MRHFVPAGHARPTYAVDYLLQCSSDKSLMPITPQSLLSAAHTILLRVTRQQRVTH